eukprot:1357345-Amorphochlora_amoeboformis.AAC.1
MDRVATCLRLFGEFRGFRSSRPALTLVARVLTRYLFGVRIVFLFSGTPHPQPRFGPPLSPSQFLAEASPGSILPDGGLEKKLVV